MAISDHGEDRSRKEICTKIEKVIAVATNSPKVKEIKRASIMKAPGGPYGADRDIVTCLVDKNTKDDRRE